MRNSENNHQAITRIERLMDLLSDENMVIEITMPLDRAIGSFQFKLKSSISYRDFNGAITEFIRYIYLHGIRLKRHLTPDEA